MDAHREVNLWNPAFTGKRKTNDNVLRRTLPEFPIQLTNTTGTYLEHLNEDCLLEIFSSNLLTTMDLCSLAEACTRFKQIIERVFPKDYGIVPDYRGYEFRSKNATNFHANLQDAERILKNFGSHLTELEIRSGDQDFVNLVGMYCGDVTLNHLKIFDWKCIEGVKMHMNSIFQRLQKLGISYCHFLNDVAYQSLNCDSLIELKISDSSDCVVFLKQTFPSLERFSWCNSLVYTRDSNNASHLYKFIRRHGHLKAIDVYDESVSRSGLLHVIDSTCKELEELTIDGSSSSQIYIDFSTVGGTVRGLSKLKILDFNFDFDDPNKYNTFLQALTSLETIKISHVNKFPVEMLDVLSKLQNLRELHLMFFRLDQIQLTMLPQLRKVYLYGAYCHIDFPNMIKHLINLEDLEYVEVGDLLCYHYRLEEDEVTEIFKIIEQREHVLTLKFRFHFNLRKIRNKNQKVKLIRRNSAG